MMARWMSRVQVGDVGGTQIAFHPHDAARLWSCDHARNRVTVTT